MRDEQGDDFVRAESRVAHAREDHVVRVGRLRAKEVGRGAGDVGATGQEWEVRTICVGDANGAGELDAAGPGSTLRSRWWEAHVQVSE